MIALSTRLAWGACLLALSATPAFAQATTRLDWQRADNATACIDALELEAAVEAQLDADALSSAADAAIVIVGRVERTQRPRGFRAAVSVLRSGQVSGVRDVVSAGRDCRKLDDALVLVIAMALEQRSAADGASYDVAPIERDMATEASASSAETVLAVPAATAAVEPTPAAAIPPPATRNTPSRAQPQPARVRRVEARAQVRASSRSRPLARPARAPVSPPTREDDDAQRPTRSTEDDTASIDDEVEGDDVARVRWSVSAGGAISSGWMPGPAGGASASLGWQASDRLSIEAAGMWWPAGEQPTDAGSLRFAIGYGQIRLCPMLVRTKVWIDACAGISVGTIHAEGRNFDRENRSDQSLLLGATFATRVLVRIAGPWSVRGVLALDMPWLRDRYSVQVAAGDRVQLHRVSALVGALGIELVARL